MNYVTRIAPSPTGYLHIGGIRTALFCYALARKSKGKFILRIEDTDQSRLVEDAEDDIVEMLNKYGLNFDEQYKQTERKDIYKEYAEKLIADGKAYYCFTTKEEIESARELAEKSGEQFRFRSPFRDLSLSESRQRIKKGEEYVVRLKVPLDEEIHFSDALQGNMKFNSSEVDDTVLLKSDGLPTYHLAVVVDDHLMGVTHVLRGVEWIPSIPKHVLIYKAFGWDMPVFVHLPVILDPDGGKLSKRKGTVSARDFLLQGYLPEAILNFLMLLGWSPPHKRDFGQAEREIFSIKEFVEIFDLKDLNKSSGVFNREKLIWFNKQYINNLTTDELIKKYGEWHIKYGGDKNLRAEISKKGEDYLAEAINLVKERIRLLSEFDEELRLFYFQPPKISFSDFKQIKQLSSEDINNILSKFVEKLEKQKSLIDWSHQDWESTVRKIAEDNGFQAGKVFMTLRLALTSSDKTPPLYEVMHLLGKEESLSRIKKYI